MQASFLVVSSLLSLNTLFIVCLKSTCSFSAVTKNVIFPTHLNSLTVLVEQIFGQKTRLRTLQCICIGSMEPIANVQILLTTLHT